MLFIILSNAVYAQGDKMKDLYTADYSSSFKIGDDANARKILELWKDWDDNKLDRHDYFSDTVAMYFPDGSTVKGKKEAYEGAVKYRASQGTVKSTVHAWVPLRSTDKNQDVVCIWGKEEATAADGKVTVQELQEVWGFNKDGKIVWFRQYSAKHGEIKK
jgi:hypothetical protein